MSLIEKAGLAALHRLDPEKAHRLAIRALKAGFGPKSTPDPMLATRVFGIDLPSPVGVAAGFDKNAEAPRDASGRFRFYGNRRGDTETPGGKSETKAFPP